MAVAEVAAALRFMHRVNGLIVVGPYCCDKFVASSANKSVEAICKVVTKLTALPLPSQDQCVIFKMFAQMRVAQLQPVELFSKLN